MKWTNQSYHRARGRKDMQKTMPNFFKPDGKSKPQRPRSFRSIA